MAANNANEAISKYFLFIIVLEFFAKLSIMCYKTVTMRILKN